MQTFAQTLIDRAKQNDTRNNNSNTQAKQNRNTILHKEHERGRETKPKQNRKKQHETIKVQLILLTLQKHAPFSFSRIKLCRL